MITLFTRLWSQEYIPPVFALVMHAFIIRQSGPQDAYTSVMITGAQNLFVLDVMSGTVRFYCSWSQCNEA